jgi:hypothetical protein
VRGAGRDVLSGPNTSLAVCIRPRSLYTGTRSTVNPNVRNPCPMHLAGLCPWLPASVAADHVIAG